MKFFKITVFSFFALAACGSLRAQDLRGVVRDAENQPLVGASVYWAGTTIGASTDARCVPPSPRKGLRQARGFVSWASSTTRWT